MSERSSAPPKPIINDNTTVDLERKQTKTIIHFILIKNIYISRLLGIHSLSLERIIQNIIATCSDIPVSIHEHEGTEDDVDQGS